MIPTLQKMMRSSIKSCSWAHGHPKVIFNTFNVIIILWHSYHCRSYHYSFIIPIVAMIMFLTSLFSLSSSVPWIESPLAASSHLSAQVRVLFETAVQSHGDLRIFPAVIWGWFLRPVKMLLFGDGLWRLTILRSFSCSILLFVPWSDLQCTMGY